MKIERVTEANPELVESMNRLLPQLTESARRVSLEDISGLLKSDNTYLLIAKKDEVIVGSLTLVIAEIPTGRKGYIEDVVVDSATRGSGLGKALMEEAIRIAKENKVRKLELTSSPSRVSANLLYQKLGFVKRETNAYQMLIP